MVKVEEPALSEVEVEEPALSDIVARHGLINHKQSD